MWFFEAIAVAWFYGVEQFSLDVEEMLGHQPGFFWRISWKLVSPAFLFIVIILDFLTFPSLKYDDYVYPEWETIAGWVFSLSSTVLIPVVAIIKLIQAPGTWPQVSKLRKTVSSKQRLQVNVILFQKWALSISPGREHNNILKTNCVKRFAVR